MQHMKVFKSDMESKTISVWKKTSEDSEKNI